jgi:RNA polymerase primary sigma factor
MARHDLRNDESYGLLNQYLQEIARVPRLTPEEERDLGRRVQQENDKDALERLVKANLRFVVSYAKRFRNSQVHFLDLINEGNIGLIQAAKKYDPEKNVKFITYAVWWIRQSILHALSEQGGAFRLPPKRANMMYRIEKMISTVHSEQNRMPSNDELATDLGIDVKEIERLMQVSNENFSLNAEIAEGSDTELVDILEQTMVPSAEVELEQQAVREELLHQMSGLTPKERLVLTLRHGVSDNVPKTIHDIAEFLGNDPLRVAEVLKRAISKLCDVLSVDEAELAQLMLHTNPNPRASFTYWVTLGDVGEASPKVDATRRNHLLTIQQNAILQREIASLNIEERTVLGLRFGILQDDELTLRDIGEILNLSRERVRQIEARAEAKCRRTVRRDVMH